METSETARTRTAWAAGKVRAGCLGALFSPVFAACVADREVRNDVGAEPVVYESRTGVPLLMDLPLVGWLFQHRVTAR